VSRTFSAEGLFVLTWYEGYDEGIRMKQAAFIVCSVLIIIGAVHFYWTLGGSAGKAGAIPSRNGAPVLSPGRVSTALVGVALFGMAATIGSAAGFLPPLLPVGVLQGASGLLALIFAARAIGDLHYVGFFKRVRGSVFAHRDTWFYSPLCLLLAALIARVALG